MSRFLRRVDVRDHDAHRAAVEHPRRHGELAVGHPHDRRHAGSGPPPSSQAVSIDVEPCSQSMNIQSKPADFMILMMSTLRTRRMPQPDRQLTLLRPTWRR
jgi:hypothetical protein